MSVHKKILTEILVDGKKLGRHVKHDQRSLQYDLKALTDHTVTPTTKAWKRNCPPFDQGDIGSCTGNATVGMLMTDPFFVPGRVLGESDAVAIYSKATQIDPQGGQSYPPDDTGSCGIDVMKAAMSLGYLTAFHNGFEFEVVQKYISSEGPFIFGINWYSTFDSPDHNGVVSLPASATNRGGHEVQVAEIDMENERFGVWNSWGTDYGVGGKFYMPFSVFERLMAEEGDVTAGVTAAIV